ncbi:MAG TPA: hypothetical protein VI934_00160 [Candidatus Nanoarchaeia archaeon]|nr:hypothetical protein [Candidatus Nanoarchaeia archaeon]
MRKRSGALLALALLFLITTMEIVWAIQPEFPDYVIEKGLIQIQICMKPQDQANPIAFEDRHGSTAIGLVQGTKACNSANEQLEWVTLNKNNYHGVIINPGRAGTPETLLYRRIAAVSGYSDPGELPPVIGTSADGDKLDELPFQANKTDYVFQADEKGKTRSISQYKGLHYAEELSIINRDSLRFFDFLEPYTVLKLDENGVWTTDDDLWPWRLKVRKIEVTPAECVGIESDKFDPNAPLFDTPTGKYLFDSKGGACVRGSAIKASDTELKLPGSWEAIAFSKDMEGLLLANRQGTCGIDIAWGPYDPTTKAFNRLHFKNDKRTIGNEMIGKAMWVYTYPERESCKLGTKGYADALGSAANLKAGWNFISISQGMSKSGKSLNQMRGTCTIEKIRYYFPELCTGARLRGSHELNNVCSADFAKISPDTTIRDIHLGKAFVIRVTSDCVLATDEGAALTCSTPGAVLQGGKYCSLSGKVTDQKPGGLGCGNNFECSTNMCLGGSCLTREQCLSVCGSLGIQFCNCGT